MGDLSHPLRLVIVVLYCLITHGHRGICKVFWDNPYQQNLTTQVVTAVEGNQVLFASTDTLTYKYERNFMAKILTTLILLIMFPAFSMACSITAADKASGGRCVDVGGYQMYMRIFGQSSPHVVFDSGSGDDSTVWNAVAPQVAKFSQVIIYDRAGLGKSDAKPGDKPLSSQDSVDALKLLLKKENIKPPYILVGHSRGGLNMQLFAQKYPREIAGMVLIDSASRDQSFHDPAPPKSDPAYREAITFDQSRLQVKNAGPFPAIPLIILTATHHHEPAQREELWRKWQHGITQLSPKSMQLFAWNSGHYVQKQQPKLVVDAIYTMVKLTNQDK